MGNKIVTDSNLIGKIEIFGAEYYAYLNDVTWYVKQNSGTSVDAEDLYQDALIILLEKLSQDNFILKASLKTYIIAICKNLWLKSLRNNRITVNIDEGAHMDFFDEISLDVEKEESQEEKLQTYLLKITDHCQELIEDLYIKSADLKEIQKKYKYTTKHSLSNQKYKCLQQIKKFREKDTKK